MFICQKCFDIVCASHNNTFNFKTALFIKRSWFIATLLDRVDTVSSEGNKIKTSVHTHTKGISLRLSLTSCVYLQFQAQTYRELNIISQPLYKLLFGTKIETAAGPTHAQSLLQYMQHAAGSFNNCIVRVKHSPPCNSLCYRKIIE